MVTMKKRSSFSLINYQSLALLLALLSTLVFKAHLFDYSGGDHKAHLHFAQAGLQGHGYPPHFLYHITLNLLSGFSGNETALAWAALILLMFALLLKLLLTVRFIQYYQSKSAQTLNHSMAIVTVFIFFFISPLVNWWQFPYIYRGQFSPTVWHNPTTILLIPMALGIFYCLRPDDVPRQRKLVLAAILLALSVLLKPNFALALIPAMFLAFLLRYFTRRELIITTLPSVCILGWQFLRTYTQTSSAVSSVYTNHVIFSPMTVFTYFSKIPVGSCLVSFAFPLCFYFCYKSKVKFKKTYAMTWLILLTALAEFILLAESDGSKILYTGNFLWGTVPATYLLFLVSFTELLHIKEPRPNNWKLILCWLFVLGHGISGIMFFIRAAMGFDFYA